MYCTNCGKHNPENSEFCKFCGNKFSIHKTYSVKDPPYPYEISTSKLVILSICTFGLYNIYWFYKQKKSFYAESNEKHGKIYIFFDAIFAAFTAYMLFKQVSKAVKSIDKAERGLEAGWLAIAYFVLLACWRLPNSYSWIGALSILPLIPLQKSINFYWHKKYGEKVIASKFGFWNWVWTIVGGLVLILALYGTFGTSNNSTSTSDNSSASSNNSTTQVNSPSRSPVDNSQSVIDIACDNKEGGSGTIFAKSGVVLTNNHVITGAKSCLITLPDTTTGQPKSIYTATPIVVPNLSQQYDLAFLRIDGAYTDNKGKSWGTYPTNFPAFTPPSSCSKYSPHLSDYVRIYGYPVTSGGYNLTVTDGIISSFDNNNDILTSAKIDSGNSGGLAVNKDGCFLGVPSAVVSGNYQNLGVIIPSSVILDFANNVNSPYQSSNNATAQNQTFDTSCLTLNKAQMYGNSYYENNPTYIASLYNGCSQAVKNVAIKVNFYAEGSSIPSDTQYVDLGITYLGAGDAHAIDGTITTPFDTSGAFKWDAQVYSADPY